MSAGAATTEAIASAAAQQPCQSQQAEWHRMALESAVAIDHALQVMMYAIINAAH